MGDNGEAVGEGNGTLLGPIGRSQTSVPGLALSCPYHWTSASSEHRGLLRKQLSLKVLQRKKDQNQNRCRAAFLSLSAVCELFCCCSICDGARLSVVY